MKLSKCQSIEMSMYLSERQYVYRRNASDGAVMLLSDWSVFDNLTVKMSRVRHCLNSVGTCRSGWFYERFCHEKIFLSFDNTDVGIYWGWTCLHTPRNKTYRTSDQKPLMNACIFIQHWLFGHRFLVYFSRGKESESILHNHDDNRHNGIVRGLGGWIPPWELFTYR